MGLTLVAVPEPSGLPSASARGPCALVVLDLCGDGRTGAADCLFALGQNPALRVAPRVALVGEAHADAVCRLLLDGLDDVVRLPDDAARLAARAQVGKARAEAGRAPLDDYRPVLETSPVPLWIFDEETLRFVLVSDGAVREYGWSREEFLGGLTLRDIRPLEGLAELDAALAKRRPVRTYVVTHRRKDGSTFSAQILCHAVWLNERRVGFVVAQDVTERLRDAEALRRSLDTHRTFLERTGDGVFTHIRDHVTLVYANPAFAAFLGYDGPADVIGRPGLELVHPDERPLIQRRIAQIFESSRPSPPREVRFLSRDGSIRLAETRGIAVTTRASPPSP